MSLSTMPDPQSWSDILKEKESERNRPPPVEFYKREPIVKHYEAGILSQSPPDHYTQEITADTHMYATTSIFDEPEQENRITRPPKDHGLDILAWSNKPVPIPKPRVRNYDYVKRDFNTVTGKPNESGFKSTLKRILDERDRSQSMKMTRQIDPISNTFHSDELEKTRLEHDGIQHTTKFAATLERLPQNERRSHSGSLNIITGEAKTEEDAKSFDDFPNSTVGRAQKGILQETALLKKREDLFQREQQRVSCRFNNGRSSELRNFNIINMTQTNAVMDQKVKEKPTVWEWCQAERILS